MTEYLVCTGERVNGGLRIPTTPQYNASGASEVCKSSLKALNISLFSVCSRNQLSTLPAHLCRLPLKVLIACNNKLVSLPEDLGKLRQLTELVCDAHLDLNFSFYLYILTLITCLFVLKDVSCNEIQTLPPQIGQLEALRDLNIRRNHLVRLPPG